MVKNIRILMDDGYYAPSTVLWLLAEELTVKQAAILLLNEDPEQFPYAENPEREHHRPKGYIAAKQVISSALRSGKVTGEVVWETERVMVTNYESEEVPIEGQINANKSYVNMDSLKEWLASKNVTVEQFAGLAGTSEDFLDRDDPSYSPKLAATVAAWRHVKKNRIHGVSVKQQLLEWLRGNSAKYWPDDASAKVTDTFVKEAARIANWDAEGGRPSQMEEKDTDNLQPDKRRFEITDTPNGEIDYSTDFDDEIPF
ncbi:MAG: hypothetical protein AAGH90_04545 [Pseudomonadota bacterium]